MRVLKAIPVGLTNDSAFVIIKQLYEAEYNFYFFPAGEMHANYIVNKCIKKRCFSPWNKHKILYEKKNKRTIYGVFNRVYLILGFFFF